MSLALTQTLQGIISGLRNFSGIQRAIEGKTTPIAAAHHSQMRVSPAENVNSGVFQAVITTDAGNQVQ
jgi:hypothetical protein